MAAYQNEPIEPVRYPR